jgi:hypothetical protein
MVTNAQFIERGACKGCELKNNQLYLHEFQKDIIDRRMSVTGE